MVRALVDGAVVEFESGAALWAFIVERCKRDHPEAWAPDGKLLTFERGSTWEEKRRSWERRQAGGKVDPEPLEDDAT